MKHFSIIFYPLLLVLLLLNSIVSADSELGASEEKESVDPVAIMNQAYWTVRIDGAESISTLTIINQKGKKRIRKTAVISKLFDSGTTEKRLIRFLEPSDVKGTGLLTYDHEKKDDEIWLFLPALHKSRRIISSDKAKSFMGSEFTYADMTPPPVDDFTHIVKGEETVSNVTCWVIESIPKTDESKKENGYSKKISWIGQDDYVVRKSQYFDLKGQLEKELTVEDVDEIDKINHKYRALFLKMENKQNGRQSELKVEKIKLRDDIPEDYFTIRYLERF